MAGRITRPFSFEHYLANFMQHLMALDMGSIMTENHRILEAAKRAKRAKPVNDLNLEWWGSLSLKQQKDYVEKHPRTPYRKHLKQTLRKQKKTGTGDGGKGSDKDSKSEFSPENIKVDIPDPTEPKTKFDETKDLKDLNYNEQINAELEKDLKVSIRNKKAEMILKSESEINAEVENKLKNYKKLSESLKEFHEEQQAFFRKGQQKPNSEYRRSLSEAIRDKAVGIKTALKHEVKEWKIGADGIRTWLKGGKMTDHHKGALKNLALHSSLVLVPAAATGALTAGLGALPLLAFGFLEHTLLLATGRSAIWAGLDENMRDPDSYSDDELLEVFLEKLAYGIENADIPNREWVGAFMKTNLLQQREKQAKQADKSEASLMSEQDTTRTLFKNVPIGMTFKHCRSVPSHGRYTVYEKISASKAKVIANEGYGELACVTVVGNVYPFGLNISVILQDKV